MIRLPVLLRRQKSRFVYGLLWLPYIAFYQVVNRFPVFEPVELPMTALDRAVPFVPELLPLYVSYIPFYWWTVSRSEDDEAATRIFVATHFQLLVSSIVWIVFPVVMPREVFYSAEVYGWADSFWRWFHAPNNCLPSLHAANGLLFIRFNWRRPMRRLHTSVALAIVASTVLVKQHYVVDVAAGFLVYALTESLLRRVEIHPRHNEPGTIAKDNPQRPVTSECV